MEVRVGLQCMGRPMRTFDAILEPIEQWHSSNFSSSLLSPLLFASTLSPQLVFTMNTIPWQTSFEQEDILQDHCDYLDLMRSFEGASMPMVDISTMYSIAALALTQHPNTNPSTNNSTSSWAKLTRASQNPPVFINAPKSSAWICERIAVDAVVRTLDPPEHVDQCLWPAPSSSYVYGHSIHI